MVAPLFRLAPSPSRIFLPLLPPRHTIYSDPEAAKYIWGFGTQCLASDRLRSGSGDGYQLPGSTMTRIIVCLCFVSCVGLRAACFQSTHSDMSCNICRCNCHQSALTLDLARSQQILLVIEFLGGRQGPTSSLLSQVRIDSSSSLTVRLDSSFF